MPTYSTWDDHDAEWQEELREECTNDIKASTIALPEWVLDAAQHQDCPAASDGVANSDGQNFLEGER